MPLPILHCRTRLFLVLVQQRSTLGGARALTVAGTANGFHTDFPPCISVLNPEYQKESFCQLKISIKSILKHIHVHLLNKEGKMCYTSYTI